MRRAASISDLHQPEASHSFRDERQNDFAAGGRLLQRLFPALAGRDSALGVEIEEDVGPAVPGEPVDDLLRLVVVEARITDEYP